MRSPAVQATGERRQISSRLAPPPLLHPPADQFRIRPGLPAQPGSLPAKRLIVPPLRRTLEYPGHLGEQIGPTSRKRLELSYGGCLLVASERPPLCPVPRLPRQFRDEDTISLRAIVDHEFEYRGSR
jgi:hypothetical protein